MKKSTIGVLSLFAVMTIATACKKEYSCRCSVSAFGIPVFDTTMSLGKMTKKDARSRCDEYQNSADGLAGLAVAMGFTISINTDCDIEK